MIIDASSKAALFTGFKSEFQGGLKESVPTWNRIAQRIPSSTDTESYNWLGDWPALRKWVGERLVKKLAGSSYSIKNEPFESTVRVPVPTIEDDKYGVYAPMMRALGRATGQFPDRLVYGLLAQAATELCFDGKPFLATDHKVGKTNVANYVAGANPLWLLLDTSQPLMPLIFQERQAAKFVAMDSDTDEHKFSKNEIRYGADLRCNVGFGFWQQAYGSKAALTDSNFEATFAAMSGVKNEEGDALGVKPTLLVVGPSNRTAALKIVKAETNASGASNVNAGSCEVLVSPYLT